MKKLYPVFLLSLLLLLGFFTPVSYANPDWFNDGWDYRKSHELGNATGSGTNYPILLNVKYGSGSDSGNTVYLDGKCNTDFSDIRVTDDNEVTLLDYWIENYTVSSEAWVWLEVSDDLSTSNATIYLYYGNSEASSVSNGFDTFLYFDDFEADNPDWVDNDVGSGVSERTVDNPFQGSLSYDMYNPGVGSFAMRVNDEIDQSANFRSISWVYTEQLTDTFPHDWDSPDPGHVNVMWYGFRSNGSWTYYYTDYHHFGLYAIDTWYRLEITTDFNNDQYDIYVDSVKLKDNAEFRSSQSGIGQFSITNYQVEAGTEYFDNFIIMKFVDPEPINGDWEIEESRPVAISPMGFMGFIFSIFALTLSVAVLGKVYKK